MIARAASARGVVITLLVVTGCPGDDEPDIAPLFPADYDASYVEVRNCRNSGDHSLHSIRILVDPAARTPYEGRVEPFPVGAVVLKEEYDFGDTTCEGELLTWTVMQKLETGSSPDTLDWAWQTVDPDRVVVDEDEPRCIACHTGCGVAPDGYDGTCAMP